jgi:hypothetical protein
VRRWAATRGAVPRARCPYVGTLPTGGHLQRWACQARAETTTVNDGVQHHGLAMSASQRLGRCGVDRRLGRTRTRRVRPPPGRAAGVAGERAGAVWPAPARAPRPQDSQGAHRWARWPPRSGPAGGPVLARRHLAGHGAAHGCPACARAHAQRRPHAPRPAWAGTPESRRAHRPRVVAGIGFAHHPVSTGVWPWGHVLGRVAD